MFRFSWSSSPTSRSIVSVWTDPLLIQSLCHSVACKSEHLSPAWLKRSGRVAENLRYSWEHGCSISHVGYVLKCFWFGTVSFMGVSFSRNRFLTNLSLDQPKPILNLPCAIGSLEPFVTGHVWNKPKYDGKLIGLSVQTDQLTLKPAVLQVQYPTVLRSRLIIWLQCIPLNGRDEPSPALWLATRAGKMELSCPLGTTRCIPQERYSPKAI